jgi:hypothetical protein
MQNELKIAMSKLIETAAKVLNTASRLGDGDGSRELIFPTCVGHIGRRAR